MPCKLYEFHSSLWRTRSVGCKPLVLAQSPHAPPRLSWSRTRPRFLRLLWSALPITVVGSRQPYRIPGEVFHMKEQLKPCPMFETNPLLLCELRHQVLDAASQTHCPGFPHHDGWRRCLTSNCSSTPLPTTPLMSPTLPTPISSETKAT